MSDYTSCPRCGHKAENAISSNHFDVFKCGKCGEKYCYKCHGSDGGHRCPECGSHDRTHVGKVYA